MQMEGRQTDRCGSAGPTHLAKAGEVGWAVRKDVIHSCSTVDRRLDVRGSRAAWDQRDTGALHTRHPLPPPNTIYGKPSSSPCPTLTNMPQWQDNGVQMTFSNQAANSYQRKKQKCWHKLG